MKSAIPRASPASILRLRSSCGWSIGLKRRGKWFDSTRRHVIRENADGTLDVTIDDGRVITLLPGEWSKRLVPRDPETTAVFLYNR